MRRCSSHCCSSAAQSCPLFATPWTAARQAFLSITNSQSLLKLMSNESVMPTNHLILCRPLLLLPSISPASESFPMSLLFALGGQSIGASASASVLPMNIQGRCPLGWTGLMSLQSKVLSTSLAIIENNHSHHNEMPHHTPSRMTVMFTECKITNVGKDVKKSELLYTEGGIWNSATAVETSLTASPKVTLESPYTPAILQLQTGSK